MQQNQGHWEDWLHRPSVLGEQEGNSGCLGATSAGYEAAGMDDEVGLQDAWISGVIALVATNLIGLCYLGARRAYRWVAAGYRSTS